MPLSEPSEEPLALNDCLRLVRAFHQRIRAPIAQSPTLLPCDSASALIYSQRLTRLSKEIAASANGVKDQLLCRAAMAAEELAEWLEAHGKGDVTAAADALGDRFYLLLGDAIASGMPLVEIFGVVHASNCTKQLLVTTALGKAFKGLDYRAPDLASVLAGFSADHSNRPE